MGADCVTDGLRRAFDGRGALDGAGFRAPGGALTVLVGPSGSGKTTLLRVVAGLERADAGTVRLGDTVLSDPAPRVPLRERRVGMVFQSLGLWPHLTAAGHVDFVLAARGTPPAARPARIAELLALVGLPDRGAARPAELSGGEQQRVALARALAGDPALLLLDEPFGALDAVLRTRLRGVVRDIQRRLHLTTLLVTHDQDEALATADHLVLLRAGRVEQEGTPEAIWREPRTRFAAEFLGGATLVTADVADGRVRTPLGDFDAGGLAAGRWLAVARPETVRVADGSGGAAGTVRGAVFAGGRWVAEVALADGTGVRVGVAAAPAEGSALRLAWAQRPGFVPADRA